ncbi:hypothetical protein D3C73_1437170 [compost metagenome]
MTLRIQRSPGEARLVDGSSVLPVVGVLCKDESRGAWALPVADATVAGWLGIEAAVMLGMSQGMLHAPNYESVSH